MRAANQVKVLENRICELELENKRLYETVEYLKRKLFGRSTEEDIVSFFGADVSF